MKGDVGFPLPAVLGHEVSGEVVQCGRDVSLLTSFDLSVGRRVVVPFILPCGSCHYCAKGREDQCEKFIRYNRKQGQLYDGKTRLFREDGSPVAMYSMGGLATYCVAPANAVFPLPDSVPYSDAAIVGCSVFTAFGAVRHGAELRAGETVAVIGSGGVGASVIQIAAAFGASQIIAVDIADDKLEQMRKLGATHTVNSRTARSLQQSILDLTQQHGVDVCIEALGLPATFQQAAGAVTNGGRAVAIGLARAGVMAELEMNSFVRRGIRVIGSYGGRARQDMPVLLRMLEKGQVDVSRGISRRYKLEQTEEAYRELQAGNIIGRAIVEMF